MEGTLPTRKTNRDTSVVILIMQRLAEDDPTGRMVFLNDEEADENGNKPRNPRVRHICIPGELTPDVNPPELAKFYVDGLMDPIRYSRTVLNDMQLALGPYTYAAQIRQSPVPMDAAMFKTEMFQIVDVVYGSVVKNKLCIVTGKQIGRAHV